MKRQGTLKPSLEITDQDLKALNHAFASLSEPADKSPEVFALNLRLCKQNLDDQKNPHILSNLGSIFF